MYCSDVPVKVPVNYKAMYLNLIGDLEENILFMQESLLEVSINDLFIYFFLCNVWWQSFPL